LKDRYAYQLLLLAFYDDDAEAMETYFMRHFKGKQGALADWARFHFAGQWNAEGRYTVEMANALRAAPEKAIAAYLRTPKRINPEDYATVLSNNAERSNLYALAALKQKGQALENLQKAYQFDASNPLVELLIVREINKLEDWLMSNPLTGLGPAISPHKQPDWNTDWPDTEPKSAHWVPYSELKRLSWTKTTKPPCKKPLTWQKETEVRASRFASFATYLYYKQET